MSYSVVAEFAGTLDEARVFAVQHGFNVAQNKGTYPNGLPYISLSGQRVAGLAQALATFEQHGWDRDSVHVRCHGQRAHPGRAVARR